MLLSALTHLLWGHKGSGGWTCLREGRPSSYESVGCGVGCGEMGAPAFAFLVCSHFSFSVRFKESSVAVKVVQGPGGGEDGKLSCKKKGSRRLEVTVQ